MQLFVQFADTTVACVAIHLKARWPSRVVNHLFVTCLDRSRTSRCAPPTTLPRQLHPQHAASPDRPQPPQRRLMDPTSRHQQAFPRHLCLKFATHTPLAVLCSHPDPSQRARYSGARTTSFCPCCCANTGVKYVDNASVTTTDGICQYGTSA